MKAIDQGMGQLMKILEEIVKVLGQLVDARIHLHPVPQPPLPPEPELPRPRLVE